MPVEIAEHERPDAVGIAEGEQRVLAQHDRRERARGCAPSRARAPSASVPGWCAMSAQMTSVSEVELEPHALLQQLLAQLVGVREVAVVAERDRAAGPVWRRSAASSSSAPSRSSSSGRGRSPRARGSACSLPSSKTCATRPMSLHRRARAGRRRRRCRRSPGRGAAARRARSRRAARRRGRARGCRRRRTSDAPAIASRAARPS